MEIGQSIKESVLHLHGLFILRDWTLFEGWKINRTTFDEFAAEAALRAAHTLSNEGPAVSGPLTESWANSVQRLAATKGCKNCFIFDKTYQCYKCLAIEASLTEDLSLQVRKLMYLADLYMAGSTAVEAILPQVLHAVASGWKAKEAPSYEIFEAAIDALWQERESTWNIRNLLGSGACLAASPLELFFVRRKNRERNLIDFSGNVMVQFMTSLIDLESLGNVKIYYSESDRRKIAKKLDVILASSYNRWIADGADGRHWHDEDSESESEYEAEVVGQLDVFGFECLKLNIKPALSRLSDLSKKSTASVQNLPEEFPGLVVWQYGQKTTIARFDLQTVFDLIVGHSALEINAGNRDLEQRGNHVEGASDLNGGLLVRQHPIDAGAAATLLKSLTETLLGLEVAPTSGRVEALSVAHEEVNSPTSRSYHSDLESIRVQIALLNEQQRINDATPEDPRLARIVDDEEDEGLFRNQEAARLLLSLQHWDSLNFQEATRMIKTVEEFLDRPPALDEETRQMTTELADLISTASAGYAVHGVESTVNAEGKKNKKRPQQAEEDEKSLGGGFSVSPKQSYKRIRIEIESDEADKDDNRQDEELLRKRKRDGVASDPSPKRRR